MPAPTDRIRDPEPILDTTAWHELVPAFRELLAFLDESEYSLIRTLPERGGLQDLPLEPANLARLVGGGQSLFHRSTVPWLYAGLLRLRNSRVAPLYWFFHRGRPLTRSELEKSVPGGLVTQLLDADILGETEAGLRSRVMLVPFQDRLYVTDPPRFKSHEDYVYAGRTTFHCLETALDQLTANPRARAGTRLLDMGCGSGFLALALAPRFAQVCGVDIIGRCTDYAQLNAALQGASNCTFLRSDLYSEVSETFDVIVTNPPCGWAEDVSERKIATHGGDDYGNELPARMLSGALEHLEPDGVIYCSFIAPFIHGRPFLAELLPRLFGGRGAEVVAYALFEEFKYRRAAMYRRHGISKFVRYVAVVHPAERFSMRLESPTSLQLLGSRLRVSTTRLVAALTTRSPSG